LHFCGAAYSSGEEEMNVCTTAATNISMQIRSNLECQPTSSGLHSWSCCVYHQSRARHLIMWNHVQIVHDGDNDTLPPGKRRGAFTLKTCPGPDRNSSARGVVKKIKQYSASIDSTLVRMQIYR
jgi:hypothetical protein